MATKTATRTTRKVSVALENKPRTYKVTLSEAQMALVIEALGNEASSWRVLNTPIKSDADRHAALSGGKAKALLVTKHHPRTNAVIFRGLGIRKAYEQAVAVFLAYHNLKEDLKALTK